LKRMTVSSKTASEYKAGGWAVDTGFLASFPVTMGGTPIKLQVGVQMEDLTSKLEWSNGFVANLRMMVRSGFAILVDDIFVFSLEHDKIEASQFGVFFKKKPGLHLGGEGWFLNKAVGIRAGIHDLKIKPRYTLGWSIKIKGFSLHHAYLAVNESYGPRHRFSGGFEHSFGN